MRSLSKLFLVLALLIGFGCSHGIFKQHDDKKEGNQDHMVAAVLWFQTASERVALSYQAFNLAKERLDADLKMNKTSKKRAVVVDIDETILDNSFYQAKNILRDEDYPVGWREWIDQAKAEAIPGAVEFMQYADKKGVELFYITNRKQIGEAATLKNLKEVGFPVKKENLLLRTTTSSKKDRRALVTKNHRIVLLLGDSLTDFSELYDKKDLQGRKELTDKFKNQFGKNFIVLPNPMYGDWEGAVYNYDFSKSSAKKDQDRRDHLKPMKM